MASRRSSSSTWIIAAIVLVLFFDAVAVAGATTRVVGPGMRLTLGFLGGVYRAWYASYNGSQYYTTAALAALAPIASSISSGANAVARNELDRWLDVYDPLGLVRPIIEAEGIEESPLFLPIP